MLAKFRGDRGKANPMTAISPIRPYLTWAAAAVLWAFKYFPLTDLKALRFIHFARWVIVRKSDFKAVTDSQPRENLRYDYLLFSTNFNNQWEQYIDAFSLVVPTGVNSLWCTSRRFPGCWPIRLFKIYIRYNEYPTRYYYNAYPEASVRDIEGAIEVRQELVRFLQTTRDMDPETFADEYHRFTRRIQLRLAPGAQPDQLHEDPFIAWPTYRDLQPMNLETL
jgi:hypothetical protein